jgi:uncharacterized repeat protein (TIGR01451 family)
MAPIVFLAYSSLTSAPVVDSQIAFERTVTPNRTYAGEIITVKLTVSNHGDRPIPNLRIVDGVPDELAVVDGSPRAGLTLRSNEQTTIEYGLRARYGEFDFAPVTARTHSVSAASTYTTEISADGDTRLVAMFEPESYPLSQQTSGISGTLMTDRGSEGLEFYGVRPYQPGDPASRINWRQYARDRVLSTVEYRQQEATQVLVIVDARPSSGVASAETAPTGTELCVSLANDLVSSLLEDRNNVGALALGVDGDTVDLDTKITAESGVSLPWVSPTNTREARTRIELLLDAAAATVRPGNHQTESDHSSMDPEAIIRRLSRQTQVVFLTPLCDGFPVEMVEQFRATGYTVSMYSPDITKRSTPGGRVASAQRSLRLTELRRLGISVVNWDPEEPLAMALDRTQTTSPALSQQ